MENYIVMARRYRPGNFEEIIGQPHIVTTLKSSLESGRLAQAYLFTGPRGVGKTTTARILAKSINCEQGLSSHPCGKCSTCQAITQSRFPDVYEIDGASNRGVDDVRTIRENLLYTPAARERIYIIDEVHMLTKEAFNALLKTLEEPPPRIRFIFATTEPDKVPQTILSRCQRFDFRLLNENLIFQHLKSLAKLDDIPINDQALMILSRRAKGSVRDAISLLDQLSVFKHKDIDEKLTYEILGEIDQKVIMDLLDLIADHQIKKTLDKVESLYNNGYQPEEIAQSLAENLYYLLKNYHSQEDCSKLAQKIGLDRISRYLNLMANFLNYKTKLSTKISLEMNITRMVRMVDTTSIKDLLLEIDNPSTNLATSTLKKKDKLTPKLNSNDNELWEQVIKSVKQKDRIIGGYLNNSELIRLEEEILLVQLSNPGYQKLLSRSKNKQIVEKISGEIWGRNLTLKFIAQPNSKPKHLTQFENDGNIKTVKNIFDAEIIDSPD